MRHPRLVLAVGALVLAAGALFGVGSAQAIDVQHGIAFTKGCASPTQIGETYACTYSVRNVVDEAQDTLTINGLVDTVHSSLGPVGSGNVFGSLKLEIGAFLPGFSTPPSCPGATGTGTPADPFRAPGLTTCTLPFGSRLNVQSFAFYTVQPTDFSLPGHLLTDSAELTWHDLCNDPGGSGNSNCVPDPPNVGAGSSTTVQISSPTTMATAVHNAAHATVTSVEVGSTVHDFVAVTGQPTPTGNVTIDWFLNGTCSGAPAATGGPFALDAAGQLDATAFSFTVNTPGERAFRAHYAGDAVFGASDGACEPLNVVAIATIVTHVRDAADNDVTGTAVPAGTVVHDEATVAKPPGAPAAAPDPTGTVSFTLYDNDTCNGNVLATDPNKPLAGGAATSATFTTPATGGSFSYLAHYNGDANYPARDGACESFTVQSVAGQLAALLAQVTGVGPGKSLAGKVTQIQGFVAANDNVHACSSLNAFVNSVNAQAGKSLTPAQASSFTTQANNIMASLGC